MFLRLLWLFFLPVVVWISLRFPLERSKFFLQLCIHLLFCALIIAASQLVYRTLLLLLPPPASETANIPKAPPAALRATTDILTYFLTMSACIAFAHFRISQERECQAVELEARLSQAKLQALRMQINPHFLFNTLNAISTLVHTNPHVADEMITDLSELLRSSLESSDDPEIPLAHELALLGRYLAIEQRRFGSRLHVEQSIVSDISNALVPALILQPLVENAIRHGIEPQATAGKIAIHGSREGGKIKLSVSDSGKNPVNYSVGNKSDRQGIGLSNTRARLQQIYGKEHSFFIGQGELGGWMLEITLPFRPSNRYENQRTHS